MAGDWIKWQKGLARKPEVFAMAAAIGRSRHEVAGLLCEFWEWADDNAVPENESATCPGFVRIASASDALVDALVSLDGFASAMSSVGWIKFRSGHIEIPNFGRHNGKSAKRRALDAEAKSAKRRQGVGNLSASKADKKRTRGEKNRGEKNSSGVPEENLKALCELFERFWEAFPPGRKTKRGKAEAAFTKAVKRADPETIIAAAIEYAASPVGCGEYVQGPEPWLNGDCWNDDRTAWNRKETNGKPTHSPTPGQRFDAQAKLGSGF